MTQPVSVHVLQPNYAVAQFGLPPNLHPHNYLVFSMVVAALCGVFSLFTLFCTVPAIVMSVVVSEAMCTLK